jgi:hypothetical protein
MLFGIALHVLSWLFCWVLLIYILVHDFPVVCWAGQSFVGSERKEAEHTLVRVLETHHDQYFRPS